MKSQSKASDLNNLSKAWKNEQLPEHTRRTIGMIVEDWSDRVAIIIWLPRDYHSQCPASRL